ncbi:AlpA family phage regulatory protein [Mesorhizobium sp. M4B.F.Ca.ET.215.01.1.1]|uniref:helix-turn-helix transcriptional regulator n=1 Tax=unclassified Mesorhizobium TaxID=325217 RepID=UPI000FCBB374|nr:MULTISPECIES: AlpA family phage regulatory protein [unclassified Mesorhizobium]RVD31853.1 AlpA family phage regulatory protein [Mesorhizobium sp. M4A.F.Ca.ET.020.02.1.1]RVD40382.1 AlpA family phage regulatory protein [Mesorhizobium sp. M4B.F.Ca.ET.019.03.1.1]RWC10903.1 MAG: AlpA family phage regulatory protein [Mesorhizobium sp.]RWX58736.1 AlpA family phage regulatory protein [Mesorhizobium sp. M4B.F.Ca.ET.089.01.1.1]TGQ08376.1 AlpA family phage regulatory protein [Mesorhizobium sp. M4B.F.C
MNDNLELVSLNEAARMTSLSRTFLNRLRDQGRFPAAVPMGERRIAFVKSEVLGFIRDRIAARAA